MSHRLTSIVSSVVTYSLSGSPLVENLLLPRGNYRPCSVYKRLAVILLHCRNDEGTNAEVCPVIVSGIVTRDAPRQSAIGQLFTLSLITVP